MKRLEVLACFFQRVSADARITTSHLGLYSTLFQLLCDQDMDGCITIYAREVMDKAKISSTATYRKLIHDLHDFGYLKYEPSFYKGKRSRIIL